MAIKVVVVDGAQLPAGVDFPPLDAAKYGWEQYPALTEEDIAERCWRADIVVALATPKRIAASIGSGLAFSRHTVRRPKC